MLLAFFVFIQLRNYQYQHQHVLMCALSELGSLVAALGTSASVLLGESGDSSLKLVDKLLVTLGHANPGVKCTAAWCLRTVTRALPSLLGPLIETCMDRLSVTRHASEAFDGHGYACAAMLGAVATSPLGISSVRCRLAFNIAEELLRTATQSSNVALTMQKLATGWLILGAFMTLGANVVRHHLTRLKRLWANTMPGSMEQLEAEKKRSDALAWQIALETRAGALATMHSFLLNCGELLSPPDATSTNNKSSNTQNVDDLLNSSNSSSATADSSTSVLNWMLPPIDGAILLLSELPLILKSMAGSGGGRLVVQAATFRLRLYQTLLALPSAHLYETHFGIVLRELVAEFTLADHQFASMSSPSMLGGGGGGGDTLAAVAAAAGRDTPSSLVTSTLRSVCHANDSMLFAKSALHDPDCQPIEDQLQSHCSAASGCESLEHDVTYLYKSDATTTGSSAANASWVSNIEK